MGRKKKIESDKKIKIGVSIDPDIPTFFKTRHINISSLVNKLLRDYIENGNKNLL
jgi:hypothetical protein